MYIVCVNETVYGYQSCRYTSFTLLKGGGIVCVSSCIIELDWMFQTIM